jgi:NADH:ubiquinone oxidoreductase subunit K
MYARWVARPSKKLRNVLGLIKMQLSHLLILRVLIIALSLALVGLTFVHHHQKGQITIFLICEVGIAVVLVVAAATFGYLW